MKKFVLIGVAVVAVLVVIGVLAGPQDGDNGDNGGNGNVTVEGEVSTEAAAAGCLPVQKARLPGPKEAPKHVNGDVDYKDVPPSFGDHSPRTLRNAKRFYSREDNPPPEPAVHNLEHGLVVAWYDNELPDDEVAKLEALSQGAGSRFVAVPWTREVFEDDRHFVLTAWGVTQRCRSVDPTVVEQFIEDHADTLAPEKGYSV